MPLSMLYPLSRIPFPIMSPRRTAPRGFELSLSHHLLQEALSGPWIGVSAFPPGLAPLYTIQTRIIHFKYTLVLNCLSPPPAFTPWGWDSCYMHHYFVDSQSMLNKGMGCNGLSRVKESLGGVFIYPVRSPVLYPETQPTSFLDEE